MRGLARRASVRWCGSPLNYPRRRPEDDVIYRTVRDHRKRPRSRGAVRLNSLLSPEYFDGPEVPHSEKWFSPRAEKGRSIRHCWAAGTPRRAWVAPNGSSLRWTALTILEAGLARRRVARGSQAIGRCLKSPFKSCLVVTSASIPRNKRDCYSTVLDIHILERKSFVRQVQRKRERASARRFR